MTTITTKSPSQQLREMAAQSSRQIRVGILIFPNVEVLDFCDPFEVLSVCRQGDLHQDDNVTQSPFVVQLIAATASMDPVTTVGGMQVVPHTTMEAIMKEDTGLDILIVPGGMGTRAIRQDTNVLDFVRHQAGKEWYPRLNWDKEHSVTKNTAGSLYTSAGISAGMDMCFRLIKDIFGEETARNTAKRMEYSYPENYQRRVEF